MLHEKIFSKYYNQKEGIPRDCSRKLAYRLKNSTVLITQMSDDIFYGLRGFFYQSTFGTGEF